MKFIKILILSAALLPLSLYSQDKDQPKSNWQNLDLATDGIFGISTEKAYNELLKGKKSVPVTVAVIDGGIDEKHEDLKHVMWVNSKEIPGNGIDDDKNGYVDDDYGWNFIGSSKGNVHYDNLELTRLVKKYQSKYASVLNSTPLEEKEKKEFEQYKVLITEYMDKYQKAQMGQLNYVALKKYTDSVVKKIGKPNPTLADFDKYSTKDAMEGKAVKIIKSQLKENPDFKKFYEELTEGIKYYNNQINYHLNLQFDSRDTVADNYSNPSERYYGNNDVTGPDAEHGTHVAGIIGAGRNNNLGIKGVADNVKIMAVRAVPDGDERDKDVANSIRYAVDNGARIINMSFGKAYSPEKAVVDSAIRYAMSKGVLLVHAAGNEGKNIDKAKNYPSKYYSDSTGLNVGAAAAWIEVGASGWKNDEELVASFSNYGKKTVDVFAPGVKINSAMPDSKYKENDGTSMASPVVAGLAALIWSYYPSLSAVQVKDIILRSVAKVNHKVRVKDETGKRRVDFSEVCVSGGIVNAYNAIKLAEQEQQLVKVK